jgi:hypothetical protein
LPQRGPQRLQLTVTQRVEAADLGAGEVAQPRLADVFELCVFQRAMSSSSCSIKVSRSHNAGSRASGPMAGIDAAIGSAVPAQGTGDPPGGVFDIPWLEPWPDSLFEVSANLGGDTAV